MSEFKIELSRTRTVIGDLKQLETAMGQYQTDLTQCIPKIHLSINSIAVNAALRTLSNEIGVEKTQLAELSSALEKIVMLYERADNQILSQDNDTDTQKSGTAAEVDKDGAIEKALQTLEDIIGHDAVSFIACLIEALKNVEGLGDGVDIAAGILDAINYMIDDLQDGATINGLYADIIVAAAATLLAMGAGKAVEAAVTTAITSACAGATGGVGAAIAPLAAVIGKLVGTGAGIVTGHVVDAFNEADWDREGESNRDEVRNAIEFILDWRNPAGNDETYYLPDGI